MSCSESRTPWLSGAEQAVFDEWYEIVRNEWFLIFWCSEDDSALTSQKIIAKNSNWKEVPLKVCCGWPLSFKWCTVRH